MATSILYEIDQIVRTALITDHHDEVIAVGVEKLAKMFPERFPESTWRAMLTARIQRDWVNKQKGGNK
jgi:hypothetical protein